MDSTTIAIIFFFYGLAFFSMGLAILLELDKCSDVRLRHALRPLAAFGFIHGAHEWLEMFERLGLIYVEGEYQLLLESFRLALLAFSFLSLSAFGVALLARNEQWRRYSLLLPMVMVAIWAFGLFISRGYYTIEEMAAVADVWTRYTLAIPSAIIASIGLIYQQREFRRAGMARFGRDTLWAAIAFAWYGIVGQMFVRESQLPPSTVINQDLFFELFGFPIQLLRAGAAIFAAVFVIRFMRSFEVETQQRLNKLQEDRLREAQRREALRGDLLRRIVAAQESERQRIARELHDETGQSLTAIGLGLRGVATTVRQDVDKAALHLRQLEGLVATSLDELQRVIADLRPSHLDDLGLAAALRWYTGEVERRTSLNIDFEVKGDREELPMEVVTALFRVTQEALNNIVKHAEAQHASVYLIYGDEAAKVFVVDDGCGFDLKRQIGDRQSWGLEGMRERASLIGGELDIYSQPGKGTQVEVTIPYIQPELEDEDDEDTVAVS